MNSSREFTLSLTHVGGGEYTGTWDNLELVVGDEQKGENIEQMREARSAYAIGQPTFALGNSEFVVTRRFAYWYESAILLEEMPLHGWKAGDKVPLVPCESNKVIITMLKDESDEGTPGAPRDSTPGTST